MRLDNYKEATLGHGHQTGSDSENPPLPTEHGIAQDQHLPFKMAE